MRADLIYYKKNMVLTLEQFLNDEPMFNLTTSMVHSDATKRPEIEKVYPLTKAKIDKKNILN
jgi:hypothetical protein